MIARDLRCLLCGTIEASVVFTGDPPCCTARDGVTAVVSHHDWGWREGRYVQLTEPAAKDPRPPCGGARVVSLKDDGPSRAYDLFVPVDIDGEHYGTRSELKEHLDAVEANTGKRAEVVPDNKHARTARADDTRGAYYGRVKKYGVDEQVVRENHDEKLARRRERGG